MNTKTPTKAAAYRWLDERVGSTLTTCQRRPDGMTWEPGERQLAKTGKLTWALDGSEVRLGATHVVLEVSDDLLLLEWLDEDGVQIHVTAYRPVEEAEDDDG